MGWVDVYLALGMLLHVLGFSGNSFGLQTIQESRPVPAPEADPFTGTEVPFGMCKGKGQSSKNIAYMLY